MALKARTVKRKTPRPVDFGRLDDWKMRLNNSIVFYEGNPFYIKSITQPFSEGYLVAKKKYEAANNAYHEARTEAEQYKARKGMMKAESVMSEERTKSSEGREVVIKGVPYVFKDNRVTALKTVEVSPASLDLTMRPLGFLNAAPYHVAVYVARIAGQQNRHGVCDNNIRHQAISPGKMGKTSCCSAPFLEMVMGVYPTLEKCLDTLFPLEGSNSMAFSREFAINVDVAGHVTLYHRATLVGSSSDEGETFTLLGRYIYHKETLETFGVTIAS